MILLRLISWPYVRRHAVRVSLTTLGIVLGVAVFVAMYTANQAVLDGLERTVDRLTESLLARLRKLIELADRYLVDDEIDIVFFVLGEHDLLTQALAFAVEEYLREPLAESIVQELVVFPFASAHDRRRKE